MVDRNLYIEGFNDDDITFNLFNLLGEVITIHQPTINHKRIALDVGSLSSGMYLLLIIRDNQVFTTKFIKL